MIPVVFIQLEALPLTINGKTDIKALLKLDMPDEADTDKHPPGTALEQTLTTIWEEVLQLKEISVTKGFYELGGHSLLAIQIVLRINQALGTQLLLSAFLKAGNIRDLAKTLQSTERINLQNTLGDYNSGENDFVI